MQEREEVNGGAKAATSHCSGRVRRAARSPTARVPRYDHRRRRGAPTIPRGRYASAHHEDHQERADENPQCVGSTPISQSIVASYLD
jgi:hypothetical protein